MATGPTVRRRRLGTELRRLRDSAGYKLEEVAARCWASRPSTLSRIETGKAPTKSAYLSQMLETVRVTDAGQRQILVDMAREGHRKGWWAAYDDVLPSGLDVYVGLEAETAGCAVTRSAWCTACCRPGLRARGLAGEMRRGTPPSRSSAWSTCGWSGSGGSTTIRRSTCG